MPPKHPGLLSEMGRRRRRVGAVVVVLLLLFLTVKLTKASSGHAVEGGFSDAPFGQFAGYGWGGNVHAVGGTFTVPRIAPDSQLSEASTWIGAQGQGPSSSFVQTGAIESRGWSSREEKPVDLYTAFWSDTASRYRPEPLFPVSAGDTLSATLTLSGGHWTIVS